MQRNHDHLSTASGLGAIVLWSTTFALARSLSEQVGPLSAGAAVYLMGGLFCLARVAWSSRSFLELLKAPRLYLPGCGGLFIFYPAAIYLAVGLAKDREQLLLGLRLGTTETSTWTLSAFGEASALAAVTALSYTLWEVAMRKGNLLLVLACSYFTPLLSTLVSCLYLHVAPSTQLWAGCVLLVTGSVVTWLSVSD